MSMSKDRDIDVLQCPGAVPYLTFCADEDAKSSAEQACDELLSDSFTQCFDTVCFLCCRPTYGVFCRVYRVTEVNE